MAYADIYDVWGDAVGFTPWWSDSGNGGDSQVVDLWAPIGSNTVPVTQTAQTPTQVQQQALQTLQQIPQTSQQTQQGNAMALESGNAITQQELQAAANVLSQLTGKPVTCGNYQTVNQGGTIINDVCAIPGNPDMFDASLTNQLTQQQLQAIFTQQAQATQQLQQQGIPISDTTWMLHTPDTQTIGAPVTVNTQTTQSQGANTQTPNTVVSSSANHGNTAVTTVNAANILNSIQHALGSNTTYQSVQEMLGGKSTVAGYKLPHMWIAGGVGLLAVMWLMKGK